MKKKIIVTGGAGFVGSHLCERLIQNPQNEVYSLDNYFTGNEANHVSGVTYIKGDTGDIATLITFRPDMLYHLGEYSRVEQSFDDIETVWRYNKDGIFAVLEFVRQAGCKILYAGVENIEFPIKEWRDRYKRLCDVGVDVVIGHHPHVPQGYEKHKNSLIFYSLGNFYFDTVSFENESDDSYSVVLDFEIDNEVRFDLVYHKKIDGKTRLVEKNEVDFNVKYLCDVLSREYKKRNNKISIDLFHKYYFSYYESALNIMPKNTNLFTQMKWVIKKILFLNRRDNNNKLMLLHNIRIDSHRFIVQRALSLMSENIK